MEKLGIKGCGLPKLLAGTFPVEQAWLLTGTRFVEVFHSVMMKKKVSNFFSSSYLIGINFENPTFGPREEISQGEGFLSSLQG